MWLYTPYMQHSVPILYTACACIKACTICSSYKVAIDTNATSDCRQKIHRIYLHSIVAYSGSKRIKWYIVTTLPRALNAIKLCFKALERTAQYCVPYPLTLGGFNQCLPPIYWWRKPHHAHMYTSHWEALKQWRDHQSLMSPGQHIVYAYTLRVRG